MSAYEGPIVDVDVHHRPKSDAEFLPYLPKRWRDYVTAQPGPIVSVKPTHPTVGTMLGHSGRRADTFPADGSFPGTEYSLLRTQLLDAYGYHGALLTHDIGEYGIHLNPYLAAAVCTAVNDWNTETWLGHDPRLRSVLVVPTADPLAAAAEVRRMAGHPGIVGVLIAGNALGRPLGDPLYHPIYEAAAESGLAITIHTGTDRPNTQTTSTGGPKGTGLEHLSQYPQAAMTYLSSFVVHGVFEKYPQLRIVITEFGVAWLPSLMWHLDAEYPRLKLESPWVKRLPSEYLRANVRLSTQPIEASPRIGALAELLQTVEGIDEMLCFSSDYPHISMDDPTYVARLLPRSWHRRVFLENACEAYGWDPPADPSVPAKTGAVSHD
jgi:predicted TIM-barrel fold metal-dependent hydrolase